MTAIVEVFEGETEPNREAEPGEIVCWSWTPETGFELESDTHADRRPVSGGAS